MSLKLKSRWIVLLSAGVLLSSVAVFAQNEPAKTKQSKRPNVVTTKKVPGPAVQTQTSSRGDAQLAACLIIDNNNEIALARFASQRAQNAEVKDFTQKIVQEHEQFVSQLQPFAAAGGYNDLSRPSSAGTEDADASRSSRKQRRDKENDASNDRKDVKVAAPQRDDGAAQDSPRSQTAGAAAGEHGLDFIGIKQEIAARCLQSVQKALEEKPAAEFDKCYMGGQVMCHMVMVDTLEVLRNHSSPELSSVLEEGLKTTQAHLEEAKRLAKSLEKSSEK